jgi:ATP-dependent RNA helicase RhlE
VPETYVHRIGRTGRAGKGGAAISLCDSEERAYLRDIERLTGKRLTVVADHPYLGRASAQSAGDASDQQPRRDGGQQQRRPNAPRRAPAPGPARAPQSAGRDANSGSARGDARPRGRRPRSNWSRNGRGGRAAAASA